MAFFGRLVVCVFLCCPALLAQDKQKLSPDTDKPRVFITDSQSWQITGSVGGSSAGFGGFMHGGARPQTAEIIKTFGERCPQVMTNNIQQKVDYIVVLDHEGGKGYLRHRNKVAVFNRITGDTIISKSTLSLGGSVQDACEGIIKDWSEHGSSIRAAEAESTTQTPVSNQAQAPAVPIAMSKAPPARLSISSSPDNADIEIDGSFVGNTPSGIDLETGEHSIVLKKTGYETWERKLKVTGGEIKLSAELEKKTEPDK
jgi:hypothetical protein